jgi:superfamily II DNA or RNA helicase
MELEDFLPTYPDYDYDPIFSVYKDKDMTDVIQQKKEFRELALDEYEDRPEKGELLKHQLFLQRFMSGHTPYNGILLWHSVGTGKTGSAIAIAEGLKGIFKKALVLVRSDTFIRNFKNEIANVMTKGEYLPKETAARRLTDMERVRRTNKLIGEYYDFETFQVFAKQFRETSNRDRFLEYYSNRLIIIDEVHNLREKTGEEEKGSYDPVHEFLHSVRDCKVVLLSATPIKDQPYEFASIMNLILPIDEQLPTGKDFMNTYFTNWSKELKDLLAGDRNLLTQSQLLIRKLKGRISYLQPVRSDVQVLEPGEFRELSPFRQVNCKLSKVQEEQYIKAYLSDTGKDDRSALYNNSILYSLCAGEAGKPFEIDYVLKKIKRRRTEEEKLEELQQYSTKYHYIIRHLLEHQQNNSFIYCRNITDQGIDALEKILQLFSFEDAAAKDQNISNLTADTRRYAVIKGETQEGRAEEIFKAFNRPENATGRYIQVIIGSEAIGEGRSLLSVRDIFIVSPYWNFTDMDQAIGRGIRYASHRYLQPEERRVTIHRLRLSLEENNVDDRMIEVAYRKDLLSKQIEAVARTAAIDCTFNYKRNLYKEEDLTRKCLYDQCSYMCAVPKRDEELVDTYNLFYTEKEYQEIKKALQRKFSRRFEYSIDEVMADINQYSDIVLLRSITLIIYRKEPFINPIGFVSYIKERDGILFLVNDPLAPADSSYLYQTKLGQLYPVQSFENYTTSYPLKNLSRILKSGNKSLINSLDTDIKVELARQALYETEVERKQDPLYTILINLAETVEEDGKIQLGDQYLDIEKGKWVAIVEETGEDLSKIDQFRAKIRSNADKGVPWYGIEIKEPVDEHKTFKMSTYNDISDRKSMGTTIKTGKYDIAGMVKVLKDLLKLDDKLESVIGTPIVESLDGAKVQANDYARAIKKALIHLGLFLREEENNELKGIKRKDKGLEEKKKK